MKHDSLVITVPCSTSNLGPGFDSIGVALNLYLEVVAVRSEVWAFHSETPSLTNLPTGTDNLIYKAAEFTACRYGKTLRPYRVSISSTIPMARGLGSSAAAIVAGIELANKSLGLQLTDRNKALLASEYEGHPDNVVPSIVGGGVVAHYEEGQIEWVSVPLSRASFVAVVPSYELSTTQSRQALPPSFAFQKSVYQSSVSNILVGALMTERYDLIGEFMGKDVFHQPYRKRFIPHFDRIYDYMGEWAYGTFLSGAGPTMLSLLKEPAKIDEVNRWQEDFPQFQWIPLSVSNSGVEVIPNKKAAGTS
ncbi:hypothetical protein N781_07640 [Pontibacillus halophilus JSM 076056 = DSM 19796]|uniref:Homoserine kinase n=1 Tax=Pontibacillus halophilus JSM 076056 = DSM 19796 TaxID=1385510 RepID=A0A0A5G8Z8_9BACI|nr:homoserine kinase [Pontibacillus halophilus]KGX89626.1 hypothetical protein N781_07640 [Pontibacillus halophilus JSM 076056 = DSM 19796]